jgi:Autophagocytosis associated protein, active-site domain
VERFPHSSVRALGIHPCKHASTMHKLSELSVDGGGRPLDAEQCAPDRCAMPASAHIRLW